MFEINYINSFLVLLVEWSFNFPLILDYYSMMYTEK